MSSQKLMSGLRRPGAHGRRSRLRRGRLRRPEPGHDEKGADRRAPEHDPEDPQAAEAAERRERDEDQVREGDRDEGLPPERHELVEPVARERPSEPDVDEEEAGDLQDLSLIHISEPTRPY